MAYMTDYPVSASISITYTLGAVVKTYPIFSYTITSLSSEKIFDAIYAYLSDKTDGFKNLSTLKFLLTTL